MTKRTKTIGGKSASAEVREKLDHPVVDGDGHMAEFLPLAMEYLREVGGEKLRDEFLARLPAGTRNYDGGPERIGGPKGWYGLTKDERHDQRVSRVGFWGFTTANTLDRATVMLPKLFRERLEELGIDFAIIYPSIGFEFLREANQEMRLAGCRAFNKMYADLYGPHGDRMLVPALIPTGNPQEALDELDYAVKTLGFKTVVLGTVVRRPIPRVAREAPHLASYATYMDVLGHASEYDYDPVWKKCVELGVAVTSHSASTGFGFRTSPENFVYNHIGHFAEAGQAFAKGLVMGGVVDRFPTLQFAFLEGGVGWACGMYNDLIEHWETRNVPSMLELLDPKRLDRKALGELFSKYAGAEFRGTIDAQGNTKVPILSQVWDEKAEEIDDWSHVKIENPRRFKEIFNNFFFGCEAEDRMSALAFNPKLNSFGARLQAFFSSDVGHFDVSDMTSVLAEAYELVEDGLLNDNDFRDFTFTNAVKLYGRMNPDFFKGTPVESAAKDVLAADRPAVKA